MTPEVYRWAVRAALIKASRRYGPELETRLLTHGPRFFLIGPKPNPFINPPCCAII